MEATGVFLMDGCWGRETGRRGQQRRHATIPGPTCCRLTVMAAGYASMTSVLFPAKHCAAAAAAAATVACVSVISLKHATYTHAPN